MTHGHSDHVGNTADLAKKTGAKVITSFELATPDRRGQLRGDEHRRHDGRQGRDHPPRRGAALERLRPGQGGPKYGGPPMGFVIEIAKGPVIYHAGDTDVFSGMALIAERYHPTIALLPIGGHFTMDPDGRGAGGQDAQGQDGRPDALRDLPDPEGDARRADARRSRSRRCPRRSWSSEAASVRL